MGPVEWLFDFWQFLEFYSDSVINATVRHLTLSFGAILAGIFVAVPLGILIANRAKLARVFLSITSIVQTIPTLAFLALVLPLLGVGVLPALVVLFLYSLLPILRNTYTGIRNIDAAYLEAGLGMGMNSRQLLFMVKLPLALPVIIAGIRLSTVYIISWATLSALIGAGGLGDLILTGIQTYDLNFILAGTIPTAVLALLAGSLINRLELSLTPRGLRTQG
ncbi:MAG: ABC transporter permease [Heliobacteriaceae bacterium]|nr:ABC transporter permease [Heliobacteriaceae bacterium]MDD4588490.1 ABC transporter permease [Heliobacteriaceae bacterium]